MEHPDERLVAVTIAPWAEDDSFDDLWKILNESPDMNFDDWSPKTAVEFAREMRVRQRRELHWSVRLNGELIGAVGFLQLGRDTGMFHGIAFRREYHGRGVAREAVLRVLEEARCRHIRTVFAAYYPWNLRVDRFLKKLGFEPAPHSALFPLEQRVRQCGRSHVMELVRLDLQPAAASALDS